MNRNLFRTFSFRAGLLLFVVLSAVFVVLRILIYQQSVLAARADIRAIVNAHVEEIGEGRARNGSAYVANLVDAIVQETDDPRLYIGFRKGPALAGNLKTWPALADRGGWREIRLSRGDDKPPLHLALRVSRYPDRSVLLVGYDLERVDQLRKTLYRTLVEHVALSFVLSFLLSVALVALLNRHLRQTNASFAKVMSGHLAHRVPVHASFDQFDRLGANFNRMMDWINSLIETVRDSGNALAHDLRTPLSRHRLELRALADDPRLPRELRDRLIESIGRVDSLVAMFDSILAIAKAESRTATELFEPVDLAAMTNDVLELYEPLLEAKRLALARSVPGSAVMLKGDKQLLGQAIANLVDNAMKYTPDCGTIEVTLAADTKEIRLAVADNGPGIPVALREKAKERFFRLDASRTSEGTGLGLSLVNAVAHLHRGDLRLADNQPGLKAELIFPVSPGQAWWKAGETLTERQTPTTLS
jgi:signal transduction histidine kinase